MVNNRNASAKTQPVAGDCHVGLRPPRNDNSGAFTILTRPCLYRRCSAGPGCPRPCNDKWNGRRKQVRRDAAEGLLPEDVRTRPKSPYPKTHNPLYEELVRARLAAILDDPAAPHHALVNTRALREGLLTSAGDYGRPWFGQLMAGPQMLAYLVQLNVWMERFHLTV